MHEAGLGEPSAVAASTAALAASVALTSVALIRATREEAVPSPRGSEAASTSRAARAPARLATSESIEEETPSQTTSTARVPGSGSAATATASSLRGCRMPRSHTAATQDAGCSTTWSRGPAARAPHVPQ